MKLLATHKKNAFVKDQYHEEINFSSNYPITNYTNKNKQRNINFQITKTLISKSAKL